MTKAVSAQAVLSETTKDPVETMPPGMAFKPKATLGLLLFILPLFLLLLFTGPTKSVGEGNFLPNIMPLRFRTFTWCPFFVHSGTVHVHFIYMLILDSRRAINYQ